MMHLTMHYPAINQALTKHQPSVNEALYMHELCPERMNKHGPRVVDRAGRSRVGKAWLEYG